MIGVLTRRGDLSVLLVEQHVGFALRATDHYYLLESGHITAEGDCGSDTVQTVRTQIGGVNECI